MGTAARYSGPNPVQSLPSQSSIGFARDFALVAGAPPPAAQAPVGGARPVLWVGLAGGRGAGEAGGGAAPSLQEAAVPQLLAGGGGA